MKCKDIMTKHVKSCHEDSSAKNALKIMNDLNCGVVPVVNVEGQITGIVTDRDIAIYTGQRDTRPTEILLEDFMSKPAITCNENESIDLAIEKMRNYKIRRLPIVNNEHKVVGIISLGDVAVMAHEEHETFEALEEISAPVSKYK